MQLASSEDINVKEDAAWFDNLLKRIAEHTNLSLSTIETKAQSVIARSEAIRYIHLGNPETIIINDSESFEGLSDSNDTTSLVAPQQ